MSPLEQSEDVFEIDAAQQRLPPPVHIDRCGTDGGAPPPYRLGVAITR
jgi:hypothetical protein